MYKNILYPIDLYEKNSWDASLTTVIELTTLYKECTLHIMTVIPDGTANLIQQYFPKGFVDRMVDETSNSLKNFIKNNIPEDIKTKRIVARGSVYESIINTATKIKSDLIVMSAGRMQLKDYLLGPNSAKVVRHSKTSVLVVRENEYRKDTK